MKLQVTITTDEGKALEAFDLYPVDGEMPAHMIASKVRDILSMKYEVCDEAEHREEVPLPPTTNRHWGW